MWPPAPCSRNLGKNASTAWIEAPQVDVDHPMPVVVRHLRERARHNDAGVAEDDVHPAKQAEGLIREVNHLLEMSDVAHDAVRVKPLAAQAAYRLLQRGPVDVREHHTGPAAGELGGGGQADPARTAGDDRPASFKSVHATEPYFRQLPASMGRVTPVT
jgi:hypothetical protein